MKAKHPAVLVSIAAVIGAAAVAAALLIRAGRRAG